MQDSENNIFDNINTFNSHVECMNRVNIIAHGYVSGLIDGFLLFNYDKEEYNIQKLINDWAGAANKWFINTYPVSIFELADFKSFDTLKRNIEYLKEINSAN